MSLSQVWGEEGTGVSPLVRGGSGGAAGGPSFR